MSILRIFSRHSSHNVIRRKINLPLLTVLRLGSTTKGQLPYKVEINTVEAIKNSASKLLMKQCFTKAGVKYPDWFIQSIKKDNSLVKVIGFDGEKPIVKIEDLQFPIVAKHHFGSRGTGNYLLKSQKELEKWMEGKDLSKYIFEKYHNYNREYRIHITAEGCFYTCRKMLKSDTAKDKRWYRNDSNSSWIMESNKAFDKPVNWQQIEAECIKALKAVGLDVAAFDVKVQSSKDKDGKELKTPDFIVIESNSAPSFGEITTQKYIEQIPKIFKTKTQ